MHPGQLRISDYSYSLPDERIARYPLPERDGSKLLIYRDGRITEDTFRHLPQAIPPGSLMLFNQTKVVHARLLFRKPSGGTIEVFCLEPHEVYPDVTTAMAQKGKVWWHCLIGGASKWKHGLVPELASAEPPFTLHATIRERRMGSFVVELTWDHPELTFAEVLKAAGKVPLPPYLNREAEAADEDRYQTLFAKEEGSVAAPTASLHFTPELLQELAGRGVDTAMLTLHVGAGTFKPVKSETIAGHDMHAEWLEVSAAMVRTLLRQEGGPVIAVGTTAMRTLESLYWIGCKLVYDPCRDMDALAVSQWEPYEQHVDISATEALEALLRWLEEAGRESIITKTGILIAPGYKFRLVNGLVTNFHQPQSTLLLLVAAFIGEDWRQVYDYALGHDFRFLSYGDSSLLWRRDGDPV